MSTIDENNPELIAIVAAAKAAIHARDGQLASMVDMIVYLAEEVRQLREIIGDAYDSTVNAGTYPDGPCIDREIRNRMKVALGR